MLLRDNPHGVYRTSFQYDRRGLLIVRPTWILATGIFAYVWR